MAEPVFGDCLVFLSEVLSPLFPQAEFDYGRTQSDGMTRGLSVGAPDRKPQYVFLQEVGGTTASHLLLDIPRVEVITFNRGTPSSGREFARRIQRALWSAWRNQTTTPQGHIRFFSTEVRPYLQQVAGLPADIVRTSATYSFGYRSRAA